jgi:hypothetical protein
LELEDSTDHFILGTFLEESEAGISNELPSFSALLLVLLGDFVLCFSVFVG